MMKKIKKLTKQHFKKALKNTKQDPNFHAEGDAWVHTKMVVQYAKKLSKEANLSKKEHKLLIAAAYLHDIGKIYTTAKEEDSIRAPRHAKLGAVMTNVLLKNLGIKKKIRKQISYLVEYHGHPWKPMTEEDFNTLKNKKVNLQLLYMLSLADYKGRIGKEYSDIEEQLQSFLDRCN